MAETTLLLTIDTDQVQHFLASLSDAAERLPHIRDGLLRLLEAGDELIVLDSDLAPASAAGHLVVRFYPSDGLRSLMTAFGTGDIDRLLLEHAPSPPRVGLDVTTTGGSAQ